MKLLLSAYACEPNKGSEPAVGWNRAQALVRRGHQVHVITRSNNRAGIESVIQPDRPAPVFHYYDLSSWALALKRWPGGIYLYYLLWQIGAYHLAREIHRQQKLDCVQHVTFASYRQPSFMGGLGIPFIFGPVGGGEAMPSQFHRGIPWASRVAESLRDLGSTLIAFDPLMHFTFSRAQTIACTTSETLARIPRRYRNKCIVQPAIGINDSEIGVSPSARPQAPHFLFVGRLLYWKGLHLVLRAMAAVRQSVPQARLKIIGAGSDGSWLKSVALRAGVMEAVDWLSFMPHEGIRGHFRDSAALVFPSLHDSGGFVVLEALSAGVPVVCLDLGGPGALVTPSCGIVIEAREVSEASVIESLANAMVLLATDADLRMRLGENATARARELTWDAAAEALTSSLPAKC